ncbi:MAG: nuclear transport factor 2 family protein [Acidimicrobiaceae bacterium]|nr:nuclear transport factor 2 family protein [Acidimicrobiaceae bacterium]
MANQMTPVEVVRSYLAALNEHDPDAVCAWVSDDFHNEHTSARGRSVAGKAAYRERLDGFFATFVDLHYDVQHTVASGEDVVVAYRFSGRYTGQPFSIRGTFWFVVRGDRIVHRVDYYDGVTFEQQVGIYQGSQR